MHNHDAQPPISEITSKAAAGLASAAVAVIADGEATDAQRAEAARLLRSAADMLAPAGTGKVCRCATRGYTVTNSVNSGDFDAVGAIRMANARPFRGQLH